MIAADQPVQRPPQAKLLVVDARRTLRHAPRSAFVEFLRRGDLVIANDAATLPASLRGVHAGTGAHVEVRLAGRPLREAHLPPESLVVSIRRKDELLFPRGSVVIEPGDVVTFLVSPTGEERLQKYLEEREKNLVEAC